MRSAHVVYDTEQLACGRLVVVGGLFEMPSLSHRSLCKSLGLTFGSNQIVNRTSTRQMNHVAVIFWYLPFQPANDDNKWRFGKPLSSSIDLAYRWPHWTTFCQSSRSKRGLDSRQRLANPADSPNFKAEVQIWPRYDMTTVRKLSLISID